MSDEAQEDSKDSDFAAPRNDKRTSAGAEGKKKAASAAAAAKKKPGRRSSEAASTPAQSEAANSEENGGRNDAKPPSTMTREQFMSTRSRGPVAAGSEQPMPQLDASKKETAGMKSRRKRGRNSIERPEQLEVQEGASAELSAAKKEHDTRTTPRQESAHKSLESGDIPANRDTKSGEAKMEREASVVSQKSSGHGTGGRGGGPPRPPRGGRQGVKTETALMGVSDAAGACFYFAIPQVSVSLCTQPCLRLYSVRLLKCLT